MPYQAQIDLQSYKFLWSKKETNLVEPIHSGQLRCGELQKVYQGMVSHFDESSGDRSEPCLLSSTSGHAPETPPNPATSIPNEAVRPRPSWRALQRSQIKEKLTNTEEARSSRTQKKLTHTEEAHEYKISSRDTALLPAASTPPPQRADLQRPLGKLLSGASGHPPEPHSEPDH